MAQNLVQVEGSNGVDIAAYPIALQPGAGVTFTAAEAADNSRSVVTVAAAAGAGLPTQTSNSGKFLTTNGTTASWGNEVPSQTSNSGKVLTTNGTVASWGTLISALQGKVDLTAQTANVSATDLLAAGSVVAGMYRVSAYAVLTTADGASSTLPGVVIGWTDVDSDAAVTSTLTSTSTANTLGAIGGIKAGAQYVINAKAGVAIKISTSGYVSGTPATMAYALHARIEYLT